MGMSKGGLAAFAFLALAAAGCQSSRMSGIDSTPAPLPPAPAGTVTQNQLPPPQPGVAADPADFPSAPGTAGTAAAPGIEVAAANAPDVTAGSVAGVWNATVAGQSCKIATPQTKFGQGFRAGPLRCPAPMDGVKSWNVAGKQLVLYDEGGSALARLYSSGGERFDGQTQGGQPISFTR